MLKSNLQGLRIWLCLDTRPLERGPPVRPVCGPHLIWPALVRGGCLDTLTVEVGVHIKGTTWKHSKKAATCKPKWESSEETNRTNTFFLELECPRLLEKEFLLFKATQSMVFGDSSAGKLVHLLLVAGSLEITRTQEQNLGLYHLHVLFLS